MPACDRFVRPQADTDLSLTISKRTGDQRTGDKRTGEAIALPLPFFWFDAPWHFTTVERCREVCHAVAEAGVVVSALHRELSQQDDCDASQFSFRMAPHRCDRAGWIYRDFENAAIIDLRFTPTRDVNGRFAYDTSQLHRWKNIDEDSGEPPMRGMNALLFPPDWTSLDDMATKVAQLRRLSDAAIFVSFDAANWEAMIPAIAHAGVEGVILRTVGDPLASIVEVRKRLNELPSGPPMPLWVATDRLISPVDCVKCFAFGATAVSADAWCNDLLLNADQSRTLAERAAMGLGFRAVSEGSDRIRQTASSLVRSWADQIRGYANSCGVERLCDLTPEHLEPRQKPVEA